MLLGGVLQVRPEAQDLRQVVSRAPSDPLEARRDGTAGRVDARVARDDDPSVEHDARRACDDRTRGTDGANEGALFEGLRVLRAGGNASLRWQWVHPFGSRREGRALVS